MTACSTAIDAARALGPLIRDHIASIDVERRLPEPIVRALIEAGIFKLWVPRALGGADSDPLTLFRVVEELARADGSTAWVTTLIGSYGMLGGLLPEEAGREIYAAPDAAVAGTLAQLGVARIVDGGYQVSGRWPYASGILHSTWVLGGCRLLDGDAPRLLPDGQPDSRILFFPRADVEIIDTWHTTGLRGTGSNDFQVDDVFVPAHRACRLTDEPTQPGPLHTLPYVPTTVCIMAGVALGIARRALDELENLAAAKPFARSEMMLREHSPSQVQIGEAEGLLGAGRAFVYQSLTDAWETVQRGERITWKQHGLLRLAALQAATQALQVVDLAFRTAGATSVRTTSPFERCLRDIRVTTQHNTLNPNNFEQAGQVFLSFSRKTAPGAETIAAALEASNEGGGSEAGVAQDHGPGPLLPRHAIEPTDRQITVPISLALYLVRATALGLRLVLEHVADRVRVPARPLVRRDAFVVCY